MAWLKVLNGADAGNTYRVTEAPATVGRAPANPIQLRDDKLSRRHMSLMWVGKTHKVRDMGSDNGVYVNGEKVGDKLLRHGDRILVGETELLYESAPGIEYAEDSARKRKEAHSDLVRGETKGVDLGAIQAMLAEDEDDGDVSADATMAAAIMAAAAAVPSRPAQSRQSISTAPGQAPPARPPVARPQAAPPQAAQPRAVPSQAAQPRAVPSQAAQPRAVPSQAGQPQTAQAQGGQAQAGQPQTAQASRPALSPEQLVQYRRQLIDALRNWAAKGVPWERLLDAAQDVVARGLMSDRVAILIKSGQRAVLQPARTYQRPELGANPRLPPLMREIVLEMIRTTRAQLVNAGELVPAGGGTPRQAHFSGICVPVVARAVVAGAIYADNAVSTSRSFTPADGQFVSETASILAAYLIRR